jgi:hypothetical protein
MKVSNNFSPPVTRLQSKKSPKKGKTKNKQSVDDDAPMETIVPGIGNDPGTDKQDVVLPKNEKDEKMKKKLKKTETRQDKEQGIC